jgi:hypothetical protein
MFMKKIENLDLFLFFTRYPMAVPLDSECCWLSQQLPAYC